MTVQNCFRFLRNQPKAYNFHYLSLITSPQKSQVVDSVCNLNCGTIRHHPQNVGGIKYGKSPLVEKVGGTCPPCPPPNCAHVYRDRGG